MSEDRKVGEHDLIIKFPSKEAADHFASWLCGAGERHYWDWMECREDEEDGDITATSFHYHGEEDETKERSDPERYGEFMEDGIIRTTMGRVSRRRRGE